jgi:hypothetical protein
MENIIQLPKLVDAGNPKILLKEIKDIIKKNYGLKSFNNFSNTFELIVKLFNGQFRNYKKCNTEYHDINHTMDVLLATARLMDGYNIGRAKLPENLGINLLAAALFHDTGYIQEEDDEEGTGAKYTKNHEARSKIFLEKNQELFMIKKEDVVIIGRLIECTTLQPDIKNLDFESLEEKEAGFMLGSADLLGQMADRKYLEKLLFLYYEFKEAGINDYKTEYDIIRKTIDFYTFTKKRLSDTFTGVYNYSKFHFRERYNIDKDLYIEAIDRQIDYLKTIIDDDTTNFRAKLKRFDDKKKSS